MKDVLSQLSGSFSGEEWEGERPLFKISVTLQIGMAHTHIHVKLPPIAASIAACQCI